MILIISCFPSANTLIAPELQVRPGFKIWLATWQKSIASQPPSPERPRNQSTNLRSHTTEPPATPFNSTQGSEDRWKALPTSHAYGRGSGTTVTHLMSSAQLHKESASQHRLASGTSDRPITSTTGGSSFSVPKATFGHASIAQQKHFSRTQARPTLEKFIMFHVSTFCITDGVRSQVSPSD